MNKIDCVNWVVNSENRLIQLINKLISYVVSSTCKELKKIVGRYISLLDVTFHCWTLHFIVGILFACDIACTILPTSDTFANHFFLNTSIIFDIVFVSLRIWFPLPVPMSNFEYLSIVCLGVNGSLHPQFNHAF